MISVAVDHSLEVLVRPVFEQFGIAVRFLGNGPGVAELVHYDESQAVAKVKEFRSRGIVGCANGIAAHLPEHPQPSFPGRIVPDRSKGAGIVVKANALQEGPDPVDIDTVFLVIHIPKPEYGYIGIIFNGCDRLIEIRMLGTPAFGAGEVEFLDDHRRAVDCIYLGFCGNDDGRTVIFIDFCLDGTAYRGAGIPQAYFQPGFFALCGNIGSPVGYADRTSLRQPDVAVYSSARVPAAGFLRIVESYLDFIVALLDERGEVGTVGSITIRPFRDELTVAPNL